MPTLRPSLRWLPALAAVLATWWLGLRGLGQASFWYDELLSVGLATGGGFWHRLFTQEPYPPLYYLLLRGWLWLAGARPYAPGLEAAGGLEWLARLPSLAAAAVAVAALAALARRLRAPGALWLPGLLAAHPALLWYAREARMYTLWMAALLLALLGLLARRRWTWTLAAGLGLLTHYFALAPLTAAALAGLWPRRRLAWPWLAAPFLPLLLWLAAALPIVAGFRNSVPGAAPSLATFLKELGRDLLMADFALAPLGRGLPPAWGYAGLGLTTIGWLVYLWRHRERGGPPALALLLGAASLFTLWQIRPVHEVRYLAWALPLLLLGLALAVGEIARAVAGRRVADWLLAGPVMLAFAWGVVSAGALASAERSLWYPDFRALISFLNTRAASGDHGLAVPGYGANVLAVYTSPVAFVAGPAVGDRLTAEASAALLAEARPAPGGRWWLLLFQDEVVDPSRVLAGTLEAAGGYRTELLYNREARLFAYTIPGEAPALAALAPTLAVDAAFAGGVRLTGARLNREGALLAVTLFWRLEAPQPLYLSGAVHLARVVGEPPVAQQDKLILNEFWPLPRLPLGETLPDRYELVLPADLAPGTYQLYALLYDPASGERQRLADGAEVVPLGALAWP